MIALASYACGLLFGFGLIVSGMAFPPKVLNFLDLTGAWDPSLLVVMVAALAVSAAGFWLARRRGVPVFGEECSWPARREIDQRLVIGALMFGAGWGLTGLCPGPALVNLATLSPKVIVFVVAMIAGMIAHDFSRDRAARRMSAIGADG